jgi:aldose 1-epimerase
MAHRISTQAHGKRTVYTLSDEETGSSASIIPSYGFNLFDLRLPVAGRVRPVIAAAEDFADNPRTPGRNGTPILFPFPNRIDHGRFSFKGKEYRPPVNSAPHAIHGFAIDAPWDVVDQKADSQEAALTGLYQISRHSPEQRPNWPTDAILQVRYALSGRRLTMTITVTNPTDEDLPYGFGIHPYFFLPLDPAGDPDKTKVILPASKYWVLDGYIPTGEVRPVDARLDFRKGQPRAGLKLDDVLTGLTFEGDRCTCRLVDEAMKAEFRLGFDRNFREIVAFTPPANPRAIAVEPYTQTTDAINLDARGVDAGLRRLGHGKQDTMTIVMETVG